MLSKYAVKRLWALGMYGAVKMPILYYYNIIFQQMFAWITKQSLLMIFLYFLRFRSIAKSYFRRVDAVLLLYDVTSETSYINVREWMESIKVKQAQRISRNNYLDLWNFWSILKLLINFEISDWFWNFWLILKLLVNFEITD